VRSTLDDLDRALHGFVVVVVVLLLAVVATVARGVGPIGPWLDLNVR